MQSTFSTPHVYQSVEKKDVSENDGLLNSNEISYSKGESSNHKMAVKYAPWILTAIAVCFAIFMYISSTSGGAPANFRSSQVTSCKPCTYSQCQLTGCGSDEPYVCTAGGANNGCASGATDWLGSNSCTDCCDSADCSSVLKLGSKCEGCTAKQCAALAAVSDQKCGKGAPYVCAQGSSQMGCSSVASAWLSMPPTTCRYDCLHYLTAFFSAFLTIFLSQ